MCPLRAARDLHALSSPVGVRMQARNVLLLLEYLIAAFPSQFACLSALVPKAKQAMLQ